MKNIIYSLLVFGLVMSFVGCGKLATETASNPVAATNNVKAEVSTDKAVVSNDSAASYFPGSILVGNNFKVDVDGNITAQQISTISQITTTGTIHANSDLSTGGNLSVGGTLNAYGDIDAKGNSVKARDFIFADGSELSKKVKQQDSTIQDLAMQIRILRAELQAIKK
jgi:predicted acyltransferase (DUF342 family)